MEGCFLLLGEDTWSKNQYIERVKKEILVPGSELMNYIEAQDKEVVVSEVQDAIETLPFFAEKKLIYLKDTGLFKPGKKDESDKFEEVLAHIPDYIVLLIDEKEVDKRSRLYKLVKDKHHIVPFEYPGEEAVCTLIRQKCAEEHKKLGEATLHYFVRNMPEDINYILGEWQKLISYVCTQEITKEDIDAVCIFSLETRVFELVKKIAAHQMDVALQIYSRMIQSKESPIGILVLIARQYRMMYQVKYLVVQKAGQKEIAAQTKMPFFAVKEMIGQVQSYSFKQLEDILAECLLADQDIKTGKMESSQRVEILIMQCAKGIQ